MIIRDGSILDSAEHGVPASHVCNRRGVRKKDRQSQERHRLKDSGLAGSGGEAAIDLLDPAQAILQVFDHALRNQEAGIDDAVV